ncbi:MAG TPA: hypothetical protein VJ044_20320, partial [Candidatus Hodarchaeales archaeon]|nr:hypothetical protein [Candidatus Hodarchaeales archaeon]
LQIDKARAASMKEWLSSFLKNLNASEKESFLGFHASQVCFLPNTFDSFCSFIPLILADYENNLPFLIVDGEKHKPVDWIRSYIVFMLRTGVTLKSGEHKSLDSTQQLEIARRYTHAYAMRFGFWVAASNVHVAELSSKISASDNIVKNWAIRGLALTDRLLPILLEQIKLDSDHIPFDLEEIARRLGISINNELYPDVFNPFLYGPTEYDHAIACLLSILLLTWDELCKNKADRPFWWSAEIHELILAIESQLETDGETRIRKDREKNKPNRLGIILNRTPKELARDILCRVST